MNILREDHLSTLPNDLIQKAKNMSKAYEYIYCTENLLRLYLEKHFKNTNLQFTQNILNKIENRKHEELNHKWMSLRGNSDLFYIDFKDISVLIRTNWELLKNDFPDLNWIVFRLEDLSKFRNLIAHNSYLDQTDLDSVRLHFNSISRQLSVKPISYEPQNTDSNFLFVKGLNNSKKYSSNEIYNGINHKLIFPRDIDVAPYELKTYFEQVYLNFQIIYDWTIVNLYPDLLNNEESEDEYFSEDSENIHFQIGQFDIDNDGIEELFICIQDNNPNESENRIKINVFKYYPPAYRRNANRDANWEKIGSFDYGFIFGEPIAYIKENSISIPRNFRDYYAEWIYVKGEFIERGI